MCLSYFCNTHLADAVQQGSRELKGRVRFPRENAPFLVPVVGDLCYDFKVSKWRWALSAHFLFVSPVADRERWFRGTLEGLGYELVDLESSRSGLLRVFIDSPKGITVDDCARVSRHLSNALAVEGVEYERLEVSSPGLDRPLKRLEDYQRFEGREASVKLKLPRDGRRRFEGRLAGIEDGRIVLEVEGQRQYLAFEDIDRARLVPDV